MCASELQREGQPRQRHTHNAVCLAATFFFSGAAAKITLLHKIPFNVVVASKTCITSDINANDFREKPKSENLHCLDLRRVQRLVD